MCTSRWTAGTRSLNLFLDGLRDVVRLGQGCVRRAVDVQHCDQLASHPASTNVVHTEHSGDACGCAGDLLDQLRIDGVHHPQHEPADRAGEDVDDREGDEDARHRVRDREAGPREGEAGERSRRDHPVEPRVQPVGLERERANAATDADLVLGHAEVRDDRDPRGREPGVWVRVALAGEEPPNRLECRRGGGDEDDDDDDQRGDVLDPTEARWESARRRPAGDGERDQQHQRGGRVAGVVQGVGEHARRVPSHGGAELDGRGYAEDQGADDDRAPGGGIGVGTLVVVVIAHALHILATPRLRPWPLARPGCGGRRRDRRDRRALSVDHQEPGRPGEPSDRPDVANGAVRRRLSSS